MIISLQRYQDFQVKTNLSTRPSYLPTLCTLVQSLMSGVDPPLVLDQGVVGLEPLSTVSAGEGKLAVLLLAVIHDVLGAYLSNSTVRAKVDPVLGKMKVSPLQGKFNFN